MAKTDWPTPTELTNRLTGLGLTSTPTGVVLQDEIDAAVEAMERHTGYSPFKAEATAADYKLDPSRRAYLDLRTRWVEINSVTVDGEALTSAVDFWPKPFGGPYTWIEFHNELVSNGDPQTVVVNGKRGYATNIPVEIFNSVLDYAAGAVYEKAAMAGTVSTGSVSEIKQDTVTIKYASGSSGGQFLSTAEILKANAIAVFMRYRVPQFGGL